MKLEDLKIEYDKLQKEYGAEELDSIYNGGCDDNPDICFVFMNPTGRNIASSKEWKGLKSPWIGTKNIWDLFVATDLFNIDIYNEIKNIINCGYDEIGILGIEQSPSCCVNYIYTNKGNEKRKGEFNNTG